MDDILKDGGEKDENIAGLWTPALSAYMDKDNNLYRDYNDDKPVNYAIHTILSDEEEKDTMESGRKSDILTYTSGLWICLIFLMMIM